MRALLSVYDKTGLVEFARTLSNLGYELVSTGGSAQALREAGLDVTPVEAVTGFPEILDGRVKTLHPAIHGGLLARVGVPEHEAALGAHGIKPIDLLVSNLYPFEQAVQDPNLGPDHIIEQIDIGGPAMVRAAAKNHASVVVVTDPADYDRIAIELGSAGVDLAERRRLAAKAFGHVSTYDSLVAAYFREDEPLFPTEVSVPLRKTGELRYGENPQQAGAAYSVLLPGQRDTGVLDARQLHGKALSFNNLLDADTAWQACHISDAPTVSIIKHTVPCGLASRDAIADAFHMALEGDPVSAFGGIVALNREVDDETAQRLSAVFFEVIIAPGYSDNALARLKTKKNLRLLVLNGPDDDHHRRSRLDYRQIAGGMLVQSADCMPDDPRTWTVATDASPSAVQMRDLELAWRAARLVKSNAIVYVKNQAIVGVGAGQPNRLESVSIAGRKAGDKAKGAALASDAFFPFADGVELAISAGITAIVQPGGSARDSEVIDAANRAGITMLFTKTRHFRH